jgi:hypothetical protein
MRVRNDEKRDPGLMKGRTFAVVIVRAPMAVLIWSLIGPFLFPGACSPASGEGSAQTISYRSLLEGFRAPPLPNMVKSIVGDGTQVTSIKKGWNPILLKLVQRPGPTMATHAVIRDSEPPAADPSPSTLVNF